MTSESGTVALDLPNYSTCWHDDSIAAVFIAPPINSLLTAAGSLRSLIQDPRGAR